MAKVGHNWLNLPQDILLEVFRYLTSEEKANVRATCKYSQQLIDHPTLWLNSTIVLKCLQSCNSDFWRTLRKRRIRSVVIKEATRKQWQKMVNLLPDLTAVTIDVKMNLESLCALRPLANLQKLQLRNSLQMLDQELLREVANFKQLTHLVLCTLVFGHNSSLCHLSELKKLQALTLHVRQKRPSLASLQYILFRLPKLRELSLSSVDTWENLSLCFTAPEMKKSKLSECDILEPLCISHLQLEKLSLLNSINGPLSDEALKQLSNVCSLSVSLSRPRVSMKSNFLHSMLENLPSITELELSYLTSLDLINTRLSDVDVQLLSDSSGKTLKHLGLVLCSGITEIILKRLPKQFPFLQTLDLSGCRLLKPDLLFGLVKLAFLKEIVISDNPHLTDVIMKQFRTLTDNRVHVAQKNKRNCNRCDCIFYSQSLS
ncbi:F-box and leucine-rich repeat protein 13 isoform X2 [Heptranchias perlo]|uniref:F-box and leucine-rich repeat protein 13 isoform X2 n=1 Tax=Heptranchias perlo TaxID=212740 RepID=UPI00355A819D